MQDDIEPRPQADDAILFGLGVDHDLLAPLAAVLGAQSALDLAAVQRDGAGGLQPLLVHQDLGQHEPVGEPARRVHGGAVVDDLKVPGEPLEFVETVTRGPFGLRGVAGLKHPEPLGRVGVGRDGAVDEAALGPRHGRVDSGVREVGRRGFDERDGVDEWLRSKPYVGL